MLASALGLFLIGGTASAQNWVPATSPYGTWRQPAQATKPAPNSWREDAKPADAANKETSLPLPPSPPTPVQKSAPPLEIGTEATSLPPLPPPPIPEKRPALVPVRHDMEESQAPARPTVSVPYTIRRTEFQPPAGLIEDRRGSDQQQLLDQYIQLEPPGPERLFRLESEAALNERMRQEGKTKIPPEKITFPEEPVVSTEPYPGRHWPPQTEFVEPNYLCYKRLLFEDKNTERFGWDFGILQPVFSTAKFYADLAALPYHLGTAPCRCYECNAGLCLPGDPVPYLCYPPELSATGALTETGAILGLLAIFP